MARYRRLGMELFWVGLGQGVMVVATLAGVRVLTGLLPPAVYGEVTLGMTVALLTNQCVFGPLANAATRFYAPAREDNSLRPFLRDMWVMVAAATAITVLIAVLTALVLVLAGRTAWFGLVGVSYVLAILWGVSSVLSGIQNAARQRAIVALNQGLAAVARFVLAAGLLLFWARTGVNALLGFSIAMGLGVLSQLVFFERVRLLDSSAVAMEASPSGCWMQKMLRFGWPFAAFGVLTWGQQASDRWALGVLHGAEAVGLYAVLFQLGYRPITLLTNLVVQVVSPLLYTRAGDASDPARMEHASRINRRLSIVSLCLTVAAFLLTLGFHVQIFSILVATEYAHVSYLLPWAVLSGGIFATGQISAIQYMSQLRSDRLILPKSVTAVLGIALNAGGAYWFGLDGIVGASVIFSMAYAVWVHAAATVSPTGSVST